MFTFLQCRAEKLKKAMNHEPLQKIPKETYCYYRYYNQTSLRPGNIEDAVDAVLYIDPFPVSDY
jgi:hypothetical protein